MFPQTPGPIGLFDSGYGGLTIFDKIHQLMPGYDYVYLGDNARSPYGTRSFEVVYQFTRQAAPLLVFCLLYTPCIAAVASVKRELGNKWAVIMVVNQCAVAWLCALLVRLAAVVLF